jgi:hypothetical protein
MKLVATVVMESLPRELIPHIIPDPNAVYYLRMVSLHMYAAVPSGVLTWSRHGMVFTVATREFLLERDGTYVIARSRVDDMPSTIDAIRGRAFIDGVVPRHLYFNHHTYVLCGTGWELVRMRWHSIHSKSVPAKATGSIVEFLRFFRGSGYGASIITTENGDSKYIYSISIADIDVASAQLSEEHHIYIDSRYADFCAARKMNFVFILRYVHDRSNRQQIKWKEHACERARGRNV